MILKTKWNIARPKTEKCFKWENSKNNIWGGTEVSYNPLIEQSASLEQDVILLFDWLFERATQPSCPLARFVLSCNLLAMQ